MKKILTSFAGHSYALKMSQLRLNEQAKNYFNGVADFDENSDFIINLYRKYPKVSQYRRGIGFWFWKPFIILKTLQSVNEGDFVFYVDSGSDIVGDLTPLFEICKNNNGFLLFENRSGHPQGQIWQNYMWCKKDTFALMNCDTKEYHYGPQIDAAYQLYQKNDKTIAFLEEYCKYAADNRIITDEPSTLGDNFPEFVDHRHDQAIASLLAIKHKIKLFPEPSEAGDGLRPNNNPYQRVFLHHRGTIYGRK